MNSAFWKTFAVLVVGNVLTPVCSVALVLAIGRLNGPEALGQYSLLMAVFVVGQSCASFGFPIVLTREVAKARSLAGGYYGSACAVALVALAPAVLIGFVALSFVSDHALRDGLRLVLLALFPTVLALLAEAVLLGLEHSEYFVGINLAENIARVVLSTVLVLLGYGIVSLAVVILLLRVAASCVFLAVLRRKDVKLSGRPDAALCREFFRHMSVLGAIPIVNAIYTRLDIFLLSGLRGVSEVGVYSAAMRLVDVIRILPMAYTRAIYPLMARLHHGDSADRRRTLRVATAILLVIVLGAAIPCAALADTLIGWMYGAQFAQAALTLRIVVWTLVPFSLALMLAQVLFAADLQVFDLRVNVIVTIISVGLNLVLIPSFGSVGAATTALASATLYAGMQYFYVASRLDNPNLLGLLGRLALAAAAAAAVLVTGILVGWSPLFVATTGWLSFASTFLLMSGARGSERDEVQMFWGQLRASLIRRAGTGL